MAEEAFDDDPYVFVKTNVPKSIVTNSMKTSVDGGIETIVVPKNKLSELSKPEILENLFHNMRSY